MDSLPVIDQELRPSGSLPNRRIHTHDPEEPFELRRHSGQLPEVKLPLANLLRCSFGLSV